MVKDEDRPTTTLENLKLAVRFFLMDCTKKRFSTSFILPYSLFFAAAIALTACATAPRPPAPSSEPPSVTGERTYKVMGQTYRVMGSSKGFVQRGVASWYGTKFHGRKTANGETYDMEKFTAAHRTLPLGTYVKVKRTDGKGESVVVRVNDRGPFVDNRVIDLSRAAARQLDMLDEGVAPVLVTALGEEVLKGKSDEITLRPKLDYSKGAFSVQVGAFTVKKNAERLARRMKDEHGAADLSLFDRGDTKFFRVRVGKFTSRAQAEILKIKLLRTREFDSAFVIAR